MNDDGFELFRCKCGKYTGVRNHLRKCNRCKDTVKAKGRDYEVQDEKNKSRTR